MARDQSVRVVVTGMGALTPLGLNVKDTWQALVEGRELRSSTPLRTRLRSPER
jgi:3-oxoacyl-(acyl-carrier-protein) synthase